MKKIYGFVEDTLLHRKVSTGVYSSRDQGVGFMSDNRNNYFMEKYVIVDSRETRLPLLPDATSPVGDMAFSFDSTKVDQSTLDNLPATDAFFDIIEYILFSPLSMELLDEKLVDDAVAHYVPESCSRSAYTTTIAYKEHELSIPDWIKFSVVDDEGEEYRVKIWLKGTAFDQNYPLYTITNVVPAADIHYFLDPDQFPNEIQTLIISGNYSFEKLNSAVHTDDHTGVVCYSTRYVVDSQHNYRMPFAVLYIGAQPNSLDIRKAIREHLLEPGIASEEKWKSVFPDLFISAQFFLAPFWNNYTERPQGDLFPSVQKLGSVVAKMGDLLPQYPQEHIEEHLEVLTNTYLEVFAFSVPDPINDNVWSIREEHPTYQAHGPERPVFDYQEEKTKEFNLLFATAIAILKGEAEMTSAFLKNTFNGRRYISFACNYVEYHVLFKEDFEIES